MIRVWIPDMTRKTGGENTRLKGKHDCPACDGKNSLTIVGSRAASLTAVLVSQPWASPFNPEKKLLAFSDNVQDASHRAGFFNAPTFRFNLRTAIQKVVQEHGGPAPITDLTRLFLERWEQACERPEQFVATFLPPDMEWLEEYEYLRREGVLPPDSVLPDLLASGWIGRSAANTRTTAGSAVRWRKRGHRRLRSPRMPSMGRHRLCSYGFKTRLGLFGNWSWNW